ncbi:MAG: allantoinase AllB [Chloroflexota bacterium]
MLDLIVRHCTLVTPSGQSRTDLGIAGGRIAALGTDLVGATETLDAIGLLVLPGLVDIHVHFREPGHVYKEDFASGTRAAAVGGVTTVLDMPNNAVPISTGELFRVKRALVEPKALVDFGLYGIILQENAGELARMAGEGAIGFKLYMGETTGHNPCPDDGAIFNAFRIAAGLNMFVGIHAENNPVMQLLKSELRETGRTDPRAHLESRPPFIEAEAISRAAYLAEAAGNRLHVHHLSTRQGLEAALAARSRDVPLTVEALVGHLLLDDSAYETLGNLVEVNPPIREREHAEALWQALAKGQLDCLATDHAPHAAEEKARENVWECPGGFIGVETMLPLLLSQVSAGRLSLERLVALTSEQPARLMNLYPRKGALMIGSDADFVLVDPAERWTLQASSLHSKHPISPFNGWEIVGRPVATYLRGRPVAQNGQPVGEPGGRFLTPQYGGTPL